MRHTKVDHEEVQSKSTTDDHISTSTQRQKYNTASFAMQLIRQSRLHLLRCNLWSSQKSHVLNLEYAFSTRQNVLCEVIDFFHKPGSLPLQVAKVCSTALVTSVVIIGFMKSAFAREGATHVKLSLMMVYSLFRGKFKSFYVSMASNISIHRYTI